MSVRFMPVAVAALLSGTSGAALAQSTVVRTPNVVATAGSNSVTMNGQVFVNQGLMGAGRLDANTRDFRGETLGSFSGMAIDLATWRRNTDGSYASSIYTLPDRGPFDGAIDYRNRVHTSTIGFRPLAAGSGALPQVAGSQSQITITPTGGFTLKDANGVEMTGRDPGANTVTRGGIVYPVATDGTAAGHISLDAEAIAFRPDGSFYVSDEYAAALYYFDATGRQIGAIQTVPALLPRNGAGAVDFNSTTPGVSGRRNNQGLEAMALTPDNQKLVTILQSATVQDTNGTAQQTRNNTRILVYDISASGVPTNPVGHYVLQLPIFANNGTGGAADRTAAQSEMLALNDTQFLVLARDGLGRGTAANASTSTTPMYKSILLVDTAGATNLAGTTYETGTTPVATNGTLLPAIVPVKQVELINMLNTTQLARVGMNLTRLPRTNATTLSEKIEAMALAPVLEESAPQDFFLFVGNDNDFQGTNICFNGACSASGALDGTGNNDSVLMVYRLTLPTYVDPMALAAMKSGAPVIMNSLRSTAATLGSASSVPAMDRLSATRRITQGGGYGTGASLWIDTGWQRESIVRADGVMVGRPQGLRIAGGIDFGFGPARIGVSVAHQEASDTSWTSRIEGKATSFSLYGGVSLDNGLYGHVAGGRTADLTFDRIERPGAYGLTGKGRTKGDVWSGMAEIGWSVPLGVVRAGPFAGLDYAHAQLDGYTESGASLGNIAYPDMNYHRFRWSAGGELRGAFSTAVVPSIRAAYVWEEERGQTIATTRLASAQHSMGTSALVLPSTERNHVLGAFGLQGEEGRLSYRFGSEGRFARGENDYRINIGVAFAM